jgi:hypothetical protein
MITPFRPSSRRVSDRPRRASSTGSSLQLSTCHESALTGLLQIREDFAPGW